MVRIREAFPIDTEAIVEVTASGWRAAYPGIVPARHLRDLPISTWRHDVRSGLRAPEGAESGDGAGTHPGGGIMGASGRLAALEITGGK